MFKLVLICQFSQYYPHVDFIRGQSRKIVVLGYPPLQSSRGGGGSSGLLLHFFLFIINFSFQVVFFFNYLLLVGFHQVVLLVVTCSSSLLQVVGCELRSADLCVLFFNLLQRLLSILLSTPPQDRIQASGKGVIQNRIRSGRVDELPSFRCMVLLPPYGG